MLNQTLMPHLRMGSMA